MRTSSRVAAETDTEYKGEFRYVFFTPLGRYGETVRFYRDVLAFPIAGGFASGTYFDCGSGVIEIIDGSRGGELRDRMLRGADDYEPARGGWLLIEVPDIEATHKLLRDAGVDVLDPPHDQPWGFRHLRTQDPSGNTLSFFTRLPGWEAHHGLPQATDS